MCEYHICRVSNLCEFQVENGLNGLNINKYNYSSVNQEHNSPSFPYHIYSCHITRNPYFKLFSEVVSEI